jgi:hypothetical protein
MSRGIDVQQPFPQLLDRNPPSSIDYREKYPLSILSPSPSLSFAQVDS